VVSVPECSISLGGAFGVSGALVWVSSGFGSCAISTRSSFSKRGGDSCLVSEVKKNIHKHKSATVQAIITFNISLLLFFIYKTKKFCLEQNSGSLRRPKGRERILSCSGLTKLIGNRTCPRHHVGGLP
jgi:hypothetical protein